MKRYFKIALVLVLALILTVQTPLQALASGQDGPDYVSEVKVFMGGDAENQLAAEGYTPVTDENGKIVDVNQGAGGGWGSQGNKKVVIGYKTTKLQSEAITDLAVMNMSGGYDVQDYESLMNKYMGGQIGPFIDRFLAAINEYRENIESDDDLNRQRAEYIRAALNKFTDDDCAGAGLGDLLLNETVYEMAKPEYDKLTDEEKEETGIVTVNARVRDAIPEGERNQHCDILTLFAQADGQIMLLIYDLITRGADTGEDSWLDRFSAMSYEKLLKSYRLPTTDAKKAAARDFEDDARLLLQNWETFRTLLVGADEDAETLNKVNTPDLEEKAEEIEALDETSSAEEIVYAIADMAIAQMQQSKILDLASGVTIADYLENIEYGDGTMYDFFTRSGSDLSKNIQELYPLVASLSEGQRAGLEFISLRELVMLSNRDAEYSGEGLEELAATSVYEGVDRTIYEPGGVALTSDVKRTDALEREKNLADRRLLSTKTIVMWTLTGASLIGFIGSMIGYGVRSSQINRIDRLMKALGSNNTVAGSAGRAAEEVQRLPSLASIPDNQVNNIAEGAVNNILNESLDDAASVGSEVGDDVLNVSDEVLNEADDISDFDGLIAEYNGSSLMASSKVAAWLGAGFAVAMVILAGFSTYMTWSDMKAYYKVDFAVIPRYMVDEASITYYNAKGEKLVKENHAAYYKAVTCNRPDNDKNFKALSNFADLNGDVGQQWVALYACRDNKVMPPILADSFRVVVGSSALPAGYTTGIHMFGTESAFNMNNKLYDWEQNARSVFVYYKLDPDAPLQPRTSGSAFSGGMLALAGVGGLALGALVTGLSMTAYRKRKEQTA